MRCFLFFIMMMISFSSIAEDVYPINYDSILKSQVALQKDYDYEKGLYGYLALYHTQEVTNASGNEFSYRRLAKSRMSEFKEMIAHHNPNASYFLEFSYEHGKYDFEREGFTFKLPQKNSNWKFYRKTLAPKFINRERVGFPSTYFIRFASGEWKNSHFFSLSEEGAEILVKNAKRSWGRMSGRLIFNIVGFDGNVALIKPTEAHFMTNTRGVLPFFVYVYKLDKGVLWSGK
mgnify:CR=1 FL=1